MERMANGEDDRDDLSFMPSKALPRCSFSIKSSQTRGRSRGRAPGAAPAGATAPSEQAGRDQTAAIAPKSPFQILWA